MQGIGKAYAGNILEDLGNARRRPGVLGVPLPNTTTTSTSSSGISRSTRRSTSSVYDRAVGERHRETPIALLTNSLESFVADKASL